LLFLLDHFNAPRAPAGGRSVKRQTGRW